MNYSLETTKQIYGNQSFLTHKLKGEVPSDDRHLFGMRVESFGVFNFGQIAKGKTKEVFLADHQINSPISLSSIYAFAQNTANDEIKFRLKYEGKSIAELQLKYYEMPFSFPPGAIVMPNLSIEVEPKANLTQLLIYWQPVHLLKQVVVG